ncbi:MAG: hypothetical protein ACREM1_18450, partial [Longimicrobiales bacterium]
MAQRVVDVGSDRGALVILNPWSASLIGPEVSPIRPRLWSTSSTANLPWTSSIRTSVNPAWRTRSSTRSALAMLN